MILVLAGTNGRSTSANAAAQRAAREACMAYVQRYEHSGSTVAEMRQYAGCIDRLHPAPLSGGDLLIAKLVAALLIGCMVGGVVYERRNRLMFDGWIGAIFLGSIIGLLFGAVSILILAGVVGALTLLAA